MVPFKSLFAAFMADICTTKITHLQNTARIRIENTRVQSATFHVNTEMWRKKIKFAWPLQWEKQKVSADKKQGDDITAPFAEHPWVLLSQKQPAPSWKFDCKFDPVDLHTCQTRIIRMKFHPQGQKPTTTLQHECTTTWNPNFPVKLFSSPLPPIECLLDWPN